MKFDELDDRAKERVRDRHRAHALDYDWWEYTYEDAVQIGTLIGCEVGTRTVRAHTGKSYDETDINFSGFCSQGDGACWSGYLDTGKLAGAVERVKAEAPQDTELHLIADMAERLHALIATLQVANRLTDGDTNRDWPEVEVGMRIIVDGRERSYSTKVNANDLPDDIETTANELVGDFAAWIYDQLEAESDYRLSDEVIDEAIKSNDPDFDEDGNPE